MVHICQESRKVFMPGTSQEYWMKPGLRATWEFAKDQARFWRGYIPFLMSGRNDKKTLFSLRRLFCATNGRFNDALTWWNRLGRKPYAVDTGDSIIPQLDSKRTQTIVRAIESDGYYIFPTKVPSDIVNGLARFASETCVTVTTEDGNQLPNCPPVNPAKPEGVRCDAPMELLMQDPSAQRVAGDSGLLAIAQAYFRAKAVQDMVALWWSFPGQKPNSTAAQLYHFDMERIKFLKFFLYLSDVGPENGPHCFIRNSHRRLPKELREHRRFSDEEVFQHFPRENEIAIVAPRGSICAVDTRGLHKGAVVKSGHRLIFQVEFAVNLFGGWDYPKVALGEKATSHFRKMMSLYPKTYENYKS